MNWPFWSHRRTHEPICENIEPLLPLYADNMATPDEMRFVEAHLPLCADCRAALSWIQITHSVLASRPVAVPPPDLHFRIAQAIAASSAPLRPTRSFTLRSAYAAAASVTILGIALSISLWHPSSHPAGKPVPQPLTASFSPLVKMPHAVHPRVTHSSSSPLVASVRPKSAGLLRKALPLTRKIVPTVIPHEEAVPQETISPQIASAAPATHSAAMGVKAPAPTFRATPDKLDKVASAKFAPAEKHLPIIPKSVPKISAPQISDAPQVAKQDKEPVPVPVTIQAPTITPEPPVKTASLPHSDDLLGSVNAAARALRNASFAKTDLTKRQAYSGVVSAVQSLDTNRVPVYNAIYSGTAVK